MRSSISSSEAAPRRAESAERLTAADRPGVAQPVPERPVPKQPWGPILLTVAIVVLIATVAWELRMRALGLTVDDLPDGPSSWAEQRRRIDTENVQVAIVGDSRILFDTDLDRFERLTGIRPLQLALPGTNARPFLENLAADPDFKGLLLVGLADQSYFRMDVGLNADALTRYEFDSPSNRSSHVLDQALSRVLAFPDMDYRLSKLVERLDDGVRPGAQSAYYSPWKFRNVGELRYSHLWPRLESDAYLNAHAREFWLRGARRPPVAGEVISASLKLSRAAVDAIRRHGGDVIFLRPPSRGELRANEDRRIARALGWDPLLAATGAQGLHADDDPVARSLPVPELSHLSVTCSTVYTDSYVRLLTQLTPRVKLREDAPPPLSASDCAPAQFAADWDRQATR
ncbi:MAG TPA: hypothetical protein VFR59_06150 [Steroidobacteraceae bacterium]|nr:hypothetical protein [Steroidobacteraceae bacterium]